MVLVVEILFLFGRTKRKHHSQELAMMRMRVLVIKKQNLVVLKRVEGDKLKI